MKGLLLKDLYMIKKYCKPFLLIVVVFIVLSYSRDNNLFFIFYPCMLVSMIPITLLGFEEQSKWNIYCKTLPYSAAEIVSSKYLTGLLAQILVIILTAIAQFIKMTSNINVYFVLMVTLICLSLIVPSISLPIIFKLGVEKGRILYFVLMGAVCAASVLLSAVFTDIKNISIMLNNIMLIICIISIAIYAFSWYLSIILYKKREIA